MVGNEDHRFSIHIEWSETKLPPTPVLMNAVELSAQYAELDFLSRTAQRSGVVLQDFPQIEIAVLPAPPATSVEARLVLWAIYATVIDMVYSSRFFECEAEIGWQGRVKAHVYFTLPMDDRLRAKYPRLDTSKPDNETAPDENFDAMNQTVNTVFDWRPLYKPNGRNLLPKDVFVLALGAIKVVAPHRITDQVPGPINIVSDRVDANLQIYLDRTHAPRPAPPFFRFGHALEAARRIPGWQLARHKFAEFFASIEINRRPVAIILMEKGAYPEPRFGNLTTM
ncbi:MAG: hypothetical protein LQ350_004064 [Teloschistes chrysophthalmus]|nr:MAG: hypothetical protein LQ350_004064 [Niorma chrysophthalma]